MKTWLNEDAIRRLKEEHPYITEFYLFLVNHFYSKVFFYSDIRFVYNNKSNKTSRDFNIESMSQYIKKLIELDLVKVDPKRATNTFELNKDYFVFG